MLPSTNPKASAPRTSTFSVLISPAHPYRYRRFACPLAGTDARLAEKRGSVTPSFQGTYTPYLLPVRLAHRILVAVGVRWSEAVGIRLGAAGVGSKAPRSRPLVLLPGQECHHGRCEELLSGTRVRPLRPPERQVGWRQLFFPADLIVADQTGRSRVRRATGPPRDGV